jgi:hypothetical protein
MNHQAPTRSLVLCGPPGIAPGGEDDIGADDAGRQRLLSFSDTPSPVLAIDSRGRG